MCTDFAAVCQVLEVRQFGDVFAAFCRLCRLH